MKKKSKLSMQERSIIEIDLYHGKSIEEIGVELDRHPTTVAREIKTNRVLESRKIPDGNDCKRMRICEKRNLCGDNECLQRCAVCKVKSCYSFCRSYQSLYCPDVDYPPYVCNGCDKHRFCDLMRYIYSAKMANDLSANRRSESRKGIRISDEELTKVDTLVSGLVKKGQPLSHIFSEHGDEISVGIRTIYNYIDAGELSIKNIDLRRKVIYRRRHKKHNTERLDKQNCRQGRTYEAFTSYMEGKDDGLVVEMDTVKGKREKGQCLLTMIFRKNSVMLLFLLPDCKAESVIQVFDYLEENLGLERFKRLFPIILTDNGSEFKRVDRIETTKELMERTKVFYCDPMASWQKPRVEKNHEFIRYVIPKGKSMAFLTNSKVTLLMNHINSVKREGLGGLSPWQLASQDTDIQALLALLNMQEIAPDDVTLIPDLLDD